MTSSPAPKRRVTQQTGKPIVPMKGVPAQPQPQQAQPMLFGPNGQAIDPNALLRQYQVQQSVFAKKTTEHVTQITNLEVELEIVRADLKVAGERSDTWMVRQSIFAALTAALIESQGLTEDQVNEAVERAKQTLIAFNSSNPALSLIEKNMPLVPEILTNFRNDFRATHDLGGDKEGEGDGGGEGGEDDPSLIRRKAN